MNEQNGRKTLVRSTNGRMAAGVCAGVADYFSIDVALVRVIVAVASVLTGGTGILAYLAAWVIIPAEGQKGSVAENIISKSQHA
ncbi:MAG: PspC domain-containing protein [Actinomycetota bacterium]|nr:PspC domain-containing protein [Actinomycetota bacterium]